MPRTPRKIAFVSLIPLLTAAGVAGAAAAEAWYTPVPVDFRPTYDADPVNKRVQTWGQYWGWVETFYDGTLVSPGWTRQAKGLLEGVGDAGQGLKLRASLNALGRDVCREWAKDNGVRKVDTNDLKRFLARLEDAAKRDGGNGSEIERAITAVRAEYERKMIAP